MLVEISTNTGLIHPQRKETFIVLGISRARFHFRFSLNFCMVFAEGRAGLQSESAPCYGYKKMWAGLESESAPCTLVELLLENVGSLSYLLNPHHEVYGV